MQRLSLIARYALRASRRIDRPAWRSARKREARERRLGEAASEHNARYHHRAHRRHYLRLIARASNYQVALLHSFRGSRRAFLFDSVRRYDAERLVSPRSRLAPLLKGAQRRLFRVAIFLLPSDPREGARREEEVRIARNRRRPWIVDHSN